jgi:proteic killer suppression protein
MGQGLGPLACRTTLDICRTRCYTSSVIRSLRHKGLKELFETGRSAAVPAELRKRCLEVLTVLDRANHVREVTGSGFDTHPHPNTNPLRYATKVNGPWRITFQFENGDAIRVDLEQYH